MTIIHKVLVLFLLGLALTSCIGVVQVANDVEGNVTQSQLAEYDNSTSASETSNATEHGGRSAKDWQALATMMFIGMIVIVGMFGLMFAKRPSDPVGYDYTPDYYPEEKETW